jgi:beta-galactosidase/beta-glucuronidase
MEIPRPEYPRPDFERSNWVNLNGTWQFEIDAGKSGVEKGWSAGKDFSKTIVVPFPPESPLSGINSKDFMGSVWYRRFFDIPDKWLDGRVLLNFGAVDYETAVWVNGEQVCFHKGGYTPFTCDISGVVKVKDNEIVVCAKDECRSGLQPTGKQSHRLQSHGCLYTRVTGIWQTVWLEYVPRVYIASFHITTDPYSGRIFIQVIAKGQRGRCNLSVTAYDGDEGVAEDNGSFYKSSSELMLSVPYPRLWSPEDPHLFKLKVQLIDENGVIDSVKSYFGLRDIHLDGNRLLLNNETRFLRTVLDQGYYADGIYTAPSDEAFKRDIEISKAMGFDGARLHQKVFDPRFLYWADRLGYLVVGEFPDWGVDLFKSPARESFLDEWIEVIERDFNHPCIIMWLPFNEKIFNIEDPHADFIRRIVRLTKILDPTRPIVDSSGYTHVETDVYDLHDYEQNVEVFRDHYAELGALCEKAVNEPIVIDWRTASPNLQINKPYSGQPIIVSEYGGIWWHLDDAEKGSWGYGERPKTLEELIDRYKSLTGSLLSNPDIAGFCYTQLYDVEQETNGLYTYDRRPKVKPEVIYKINKQTAMIEKHGKTQESNH